MKNYWKYILCTMMVLAVFLTGCNQSKPAKDVSGTKADQPLAELSASIKPGTLTNTGMTFVMENDESGYIFSFSDLFGLEVNRDGVWSEMPALNERAITLVAKSVLPGKPYEYTVNWEYWYGTLASGQYRLVMHMDIMEFDGIENSDDVGDYFLYVPFSL